VDFGDMAVLMASYDQCAGDAAFDPDAGVNGDGCVNVTDFMLFAGVYDTLCP
jgi:hypothetical protein